MTRHCKRLRNFAWTAVFVGVVYAHLTAACASAAAPNIVLILCDDLGFSDIGCYGGEIRTPNIDRLALEGLRFSQFYNNAKCTTTRASLVTGMYPRFDGDHLRPNLVTIPEVLKPAGYRCVLSGKWHLGSRAPHRPNDRGFDHSYGLLDGCCNFFNPVQPDPAFKGGKVRWFGEDNQRITTFPSDFYATDAFTDYACRAIDSAADAREPLFLHVCYTAPHYPLHAPEEDVARYRGTYLRGWNELRQRRYARQLELGILDQPWELPAADPEVPSWDDVPSQAYHDELMAVYAAMVDRMDQGIGRILARLDARGLADNTLVMFLSDNGGCSELPGGIDPQRTPGVKEFYTACGPGWAYAQNTPFRRYKSFVHEGGISTPFVARWPGVIAPGRRTREVGHIIDLLPTCAEVADVTYPSERAGVTVLPCEGRSLRPVFAGQDRRDHNQLCWYWSGHRAIREGERKLVWESKRLGWELYDLATDRSELHNLASAHPEETARLSADWTAWAERVGVQVKP